jgi:hypothetical protein
MRVSHFPFRWTRAADAADSMFLVQGFRGRLIEFRVVSQRRFALEREAAMSPLYGACVIWKCQKGAAFLARHEVANFRWPGACGR